MCVKDVKDVLDVKRCVKYRCLIISPISLEVYIFKMASNLFVLFLIFLTGKMSEVLLVCLSSGVLAAGSVA